MPPSWVLTCERTEVRRWWKLVGYQEMDLGKAKKMGNLDLVMAEVT